MFGFQYFLSELFVLGGKVLLGKGLKLVKLFNIPIGLLEFLELKTIGVVSIEALSEIGKNNGNFIIEEFYLIKQLGKFVDLLNILQL